MIYVADGPSDVPAWSVVTANGGMAFGVYQRGSLAQFEQISSLQRDGRIDAFAEADYTPDSTATMWLTTEVRRIAERIVEDRELTLRRAVRSAPRHVADAPASTPTDAPMETPEASSPSGQPTAAEALRERIRRGLDEADAADAHGRPVSEMPVEGH
jgi:hypothetical protein